MHIFLFNCVNKDTVVTIEKGWPRNNFAVQNLAPKSNAQDKKILIDWWNSIILEWTSRDLCYSIICHKKNLDLSDYLYGKYHCIPPDDVQRIIRTKHFQLSRLRVVTIDTLLSDHCYDLFWDSCLEKTGLESILETYKRDLYTLYIKSNRERNESSEKERKMGQLTKLQWELLYKGQMIDTSKVNDQLSTQFPTKGLTVTSFDNDMNFVLLSNVCPLYKSLQIVTSNQLKISRIVVDHTVNIETFNEIWELMSTNLKPISRHCLCEGYYHQKLNSIMRSSFDRLQSRENRKSILESTFENIIFSKVSLFFIFFYKVNFYIMLEPVFTYVLM